MRNTLLLPVAALLLIGALPSRASDTFTGPEGIEYPAAVGYATGVDSTPIVTPEITYEGARAVIVKPAGATRVDFLAENELGEDAPLPVAAPASAPAPAPTASPKRLACDCPCLHHG